MDPLFERRPLIVENVPAGLCTCACARCGFGVSRPTLHRAGWCNPQTALRRVEEAIRLHEGNDLAVDTIAIAPHGEATLDRNLGRLLTALHPLGRDLVVFTNGTSLHRDDVRRELSHADHVVIDVDALDAATWRSLHHPSAEPFPLVHQGLRIFPSAFGGSISTITTLHAEHDSLTQVTAVAELCAELKAESSYLLPHPDHPPTPRRVERAAAVMSERVRRVLRSDPWLTSVGRLALTEPPLRSTRPPKGSTAQTA